MLKKMISFSQLLLAVIVILAAISSPVSAEVTGLVAKDDSGSYYEYKYQDLLDSYALKIIGTSNGLYEDFSQKKPFALLDNQKGYLDYLDILDYYAAALIVGENFDLNTFTASGKAKAAQMPASINVVKINSGEIILTNKEVNPEEAAAELPEGFKPPSTRTPILGPAEASLAQAQKWAESRDAHKRFIDIAPLYWEYGEKTGIRPEVLYAQAAVETDFGNFSNQVPPEYNNWARIKIKNAEGNEVEDFEQFSIPEEGVRAHFNHISAYVGLNPIGEPHDRFEAVADQSWTGSVLYVDDLSGKWTSNQDYHLFILALLEQINKTDDPEKQASAAPPSQETDEGDGGAVEKVDFEVVVDVSADSALRLRSGPGTDYEILQRLMRGTVLVVTGKQDKWLQVTTPTGEKGWVHSDWVVEPVSSADTKDLFKGKKVVVDPGHGGSDPGAIGSNGLREKEVNLAVALKLAALLEEAGAEVIMTRSGDQSISNSMRVGTANDAKADVYVSIHANAFSDPDSNGTETFYCAQYEYSEAAKFLAQQLQKEMVGELGLRDRGVKSRSFFILTKTEMPAALIELGFLTNKKEEALLGKSETHTRAAQAIFRGLEAYFNNYR